MALSAKITLSNNNPQSGQVVTAAAVVSGQSGNVSYQWKLGSSSTPGASNQTYVYSLSDGDNNISCVVSDSSSTVTPTRAVFVGKLDGANTVAKGTTSQYTSNTPNTPNPAKWSVNSVDPNKSTISQSGVLTANKAETVVISAREEIHSLNNSALVSQPDNSLLVVSHNETIDNTQIYLKNPGDSFKQKIPVGFNTYRASTIGALNAPGGYSVRYTNSETERIEYYNGSAYVTITTVTLVDNDELEFVVSDSLTILVKKNGTQIGEIPFTGYSDSAKGWRVYNTWYYLPNGTVIAKPTYLSSTVPEKLATKSVTVYAPPPADVTGLAATTISPTQIDLDWNDVAGATYEIEYSVNADFSAAGSISSTASNKSFAGLLPETRYYFRVKALKDGQLSEHWAETFAATPETPSVLDGLFERFFLREIFNITQLDLEMPVLRANFGDGYGAAALSGKPSGLRYWTISADVLPDMDEYSVDYTVADDDRSDSRFQYFWEFYRRHLSLGNKPFYFVDPRTNRKFLAEFVENRISFESITAKLYRGGVSIKQRRIKIDGINYRTDDGSVSN